MIWEDWFGDPWYMVIRSLMLITKKNGIEVQPRIVAEKPLEVERRFYVLPVGGCPGYALLTSQGKATKPRQDEFRERTRTILEKTLTGEATIDTCKDRIAETERVKEKRRARIERGAGDVPEERGNTDDEQVAVRQADASGGDIIESQHDEKQNERRPS